MFIGHCKFFVFNFLERGCARLFISSIGIEHREPSAISDDNPSFIFFLYRLMDSIIRRREVVDVQ